jgi:hypothetical protein
VLPPDPWSLRAPGSARSPCGRSAEPEGRAGSGEAAAALVVVGEGALHGGPESGGVAGLADVGEFVDDDIVEQGDRELHGRPVDVEAVVLAEGTHR